MGILKLTSNLVQNTENEVDKTICVLICRAKSACNKKVGFEFPSERCVTHHNAMKNSLSKVIICCT